MTGFKVGDKVRLSVDGMCHLMSEEHPDIRYSDEGAIAAISDDPDLPIKVDWNVMAVLHHSNDEIEHIPANCPTQAIKDVIHKLPKDYAMTTYTTTTNLKTYMNYTYTGVMTTTANIYYNYQGSLQAAYSRPLEAPKPKAVTDEQIVTAYEKFQRDNDGPKTGGPIGEFLVVDGIQISFTKAREAWSNVLRKKKEAAKKANQLSVQIDDGSADDV